VDDTEVISFLLQTEIIPLCLRIMDNGSELSKTVATFIIQKILLDDMGLKYVYLCTALDCPYAQCIDVRLCCWSLHSYICATYDRFSTVSTVLRYVSLFLAGHSRASLYLHVRGELALSSCPHTALWCTRHLYSCRKMVSGLAEKPSTRLLKHIVRCYLRLSENQR